MVRKQIHAQVNQLPTLCTIVVRGMADTGCAADDLRIIIVPHESDLQNTRIFYTQMQKRPFA